MAVDPKTLDFFTLSEVFVGTSPRMRGRKPKPTRIKILSGNPGKRPLPKNDVKPPKQIPRPSPILQGLARKEWWHIAPLLYDAGLLTKIDVPALATYCQCYARW